MDCSAKYENCDKSETRDSEWVDFLVPVEILREGAQAAWGFRLRGGSDVDGGTPLEIIKVFVGGASEGLLQPGDRLLSINSQDAGLMSHLEAQHLFKTSGTRVKVHVLRSIQCDTNSVLRHKNFHRHPVTRETGQEGTSCLSLPPSQHTLHSTFSQPSTYFHLPSPKDLSFSKPHESETFRIIMSEEMDSAKDQTGISARRFAKTGPCATHLPRPESRLSDSSDECRADPVLRNTSINQSTSFKKLMNSVMCETEF